MSGDLAWLDREAYRFESHYVDVPSGRMHYVDEGDGAPILMVRGNPTRSFLYRHVIKNSAAGHRCVALPGVGHFVQDEAPDALEHAVRSFPARAGARRGAARPAVGGRAGPRAGLGADMRSKRIVVGSLAALALVDVAWALSSGRASPLIAAVGFAAVAALVGARDEYRASLIVGGAGVGIHAFELVFHGARGLSVFEGALFATNLVLSLAVALASRALIRANKN
jgi:hypothetical protein